MVEFKLTVAGATAGVTSLFESTPVYLRNYASDRDPDFFIHVTPEDLLFEAEQLRIEAVEEGFRPRVFTDPFLERTAIQRHFAEYLFDEGTLLVHGSAVAVDGKAYLFTAKSGTGKSTHTRLWREVFGQRAIMINDDKPFLQIRNGSVTAFGAPWSGKHGLDTNISLPLAGICLLQRGAENRITPAAPEELLPMLRHAAYKPLDPRKEADFLRLTGCLTKTVPLYKMLCRPDRAAAQAAFDAMRQD